MNTPSTEIKRELERAQKIAIFGHENIDWDCVGWMLGLGLLLEKQWKNIEYFTTKTPTKLFNFVDKIGKIKTNFEYKEDYDLLIFIDFSPYDRITWFTKGREEYFDKQNIMIIDHHIGATPKNAKHILKDENVTSCCEWIFEHTNQWRSDLHDKNIATYFYLGLTTDSGNFLYDQENNSVRIFKNATKLLELWADKKAIIENIYYRDTIEAVKFTEILISRMEIKYGILSSYFDASELWQYGVDIDEAKNSFMTILTKIYGPRLYVLISKRDEKLKGSIRVGKTKNINWKLNWELRSKEINCAKIAKELFNWWGHKAAAWFSVTNNDNLENQKKEILEKIEKYLKIA